jgi:mRNA-degrading endonuclease YafQ of YafQ-DinJ toxin-antitoxin module
MFTLKTTTQFRKDYKLRGYKMDLRGSHGNTFAEKLLSEKYRDHALVGNYTVGSVISSRIGC